MSKTKMKMSASDSTDKWSKNTTAAVPEVIKGLDRVTEDPGQKAVDKQEKMLANLTKSVQDGTWAARRLKVGLSEWRDKTKKKVTERLAGGVTAAKGKRLAFDQYNEATLNAILPEIAAMPDMTMEDSVARVRRIMEHMHEHPYKKS